MDTTHSFGYWVRRRRKTLDLTQQALADRAACSLSAVKKIEADTRRPSRQLAEALAGALAIPENEREPFLLSARGRAPVDEMPLAGQPLAPATEELGEDSRTAGNLPATISPLFGRGEELERLAGQLSSGDNRLITLVGPGGVGKSRLALEAARSVQERFQDGAWFVSLAGVDDPAKLSTAVAVALGLNFAGPLEPEEQLVRQLADRRLLLLLDNFEQLLPGGTKLVSSLVQRVPGITLLATSRERLRLQAETTVPISGLRHEAARRLFLDRATRAGARLPPDRAKDTSQAIDGICRLVGGLPLALELAAAWARILSPAEILADLKHDLDLLTGELLTSELLTSELLTSELLTSELRDVPERHRSMQAVFDASWKRLSAEEQTLLAGLSVFAGSFSREAAESVCGATLPQLATLHDHSLIQRDRERFRLHELIRQMAATKLARWPDEQAVVQDRHADYYADYLGRLSALFKTGGDQLAGLQQTVDREKDNIQVAWRWTIISDRPQRLLPIIPALLAYMDASGQAGEGARMFAELAQSAARVRAAGLTDDPVLRRTQAMALMAQGELYLRKGESAHQQQQLRQAAVSLLDGLEAPDERAIALSYLGLATMLTMNYTASQRILEEALTLTRHGNNLWAKTLALGFLGLLYLFQGRMQKARDIITESAHLGHKMGLPLAEGRNLINLGLAYHGLGSYESAQAIQEKALALTQEAKDISFVPFARSSLAFHHYAQGKLALAKSGFMTALGEAQRFGLLASVWRGITGLGLVAAAEGEASRATTLLSSGANQGSAYMPFLLGEPERVLAELRDRLAAAEVTAAEARAGEMDLDDLIRLALSETDRW